MADEKGKKLIASGIKRAMLFEIEFEGIKEQLKRKSISYMPLKGAVIKKFYPRIGMREMADYDIWIKAEKADDVKDIMEKAGFATVSYGVSNHDIYRKKPVLNFEMHTELFGINHDSRFYNYYKHIEAKQMGDGCEKHLSPEDFYIYLIVHEYKHFDNGGIGLRPLVDTYLYLKNNDVDMDYINKETSKLGIQEFEQINRSLAHNLLENKSLTLKELEMLKTMLSSGAYGTFQTRIENNLRKNRIGKLKYMARRISVPISEKDKRYNLFKSHYPVFYENKLLLPGLVIYRIIRSVKSGRFTDELLAIKYART